jgi:putative transposase
MSDLVVYEDLRIKNMLKNHCLPKSINDASWYQILQFRVMDRDENAARNILCRGLGTVGHTGTFALNASNASGDDTAAEIGPILFL